MSACETCWTDAYLQSRLSGDSHVAHYHRLLAERPDCRPAPGEPQPAADDQTGPGCQSNDREAS